MTRIRFRTDGSWHARAKADGDRFEEWYDGSPGWKPTKKARAQWDATEVPKPGDTWRIFWYRGRDVPKNEPDRIAGYDICCPKCGKIHGWTTARNCSSRRELPGGGFTCDHSGKSSCWTWTGSAEDGTLSASPSLHCLADLGGCGWHGFLTNGVLTGA